MKLKVYGVIGYRQACPPAANGSKQTREIIATTSWKKAAAAFRESVTHARAYGCITGNEEECALALAKPGVLFWRPIDQPRPHEWKEVRCPNT